LTSAAETLGISVYHPRNVNADTFVKGVIELSPEMNLSISYDQIMREPIRQSSLHGAVNFHAGMLPAYRGCNVINWAIINGETEVGLTSHIMDDGIDTGDILLQRSIPIAWTDTYRKVLDSVVDSFPDIVEDTVDLFAAGDVNPRPQCHLQATYMPRRSTGDEWLDWSDRSRNLHNKIRAISSPGPGAMTSQDGQVMSVLEASLDLSWPHYIATPGQVVGRSDDGVFVKTGDSVLLVRKVRMSEGDEHIPSLRLGTRLGVNLQAHLLSLQMRVSRLEMRLGRLNVTEDS
jgi:methionyl-tRNA formyltransferase